MPTRLNPNPNPNPNPNLNVQGADATAADGEGLDSVRNPYSPIGAHGTPSTDRGTLYTNLAVVHVLKGDVASASGYVRRALDEQPSR